MKSIALKKPLLHLYFDYAQHKRQLPLAAPNRLS
ncbi:MAG: hypothetical protein ACJAZ9_000377 [Neolewinella sp.]|jgi:hypothetical protein